MVRKLTSRTILFYFILLALSFSFSGCFRLAFQEEVGHLGDHCYVSAYADTRPPNRFYYGTRGNFNGFQEMPGWVYGFLLVDLPFEIITDTVLLPVDTYSLIQYYRHLPQQILVEKNRIDELEVRLKAGEAPERDAVYSAASNGKTDIFRLYLNYGAAVPDVAYESNLEILKLALEYDTADNANSHKNGPGLVRMCYFLYEQTGILDQETQEDWLEAIGVMLENGFRVNCVYYNGSPRFFSLDYAKRVRCLSPENKEKLLAMLASHGAITYQEHAVKNNLPHLKTEALDIAPCFRDVIDLLEECCEKPEDVRLTTTCPGVSGPVLVVDIPAERDTLKIRRRLPAGGWNPQLEDFEVPRHARMIFTPPGVHVPTRLTPDVPACLLNETRYSTRNFEVLRETKGFLCGIPELKEMSDISHKLWDKIVRLPWNPNGKYARISFPETGRLNHQEKSLKWMKKAPIPTAENQRWLEKANRLTQEAGLAGQWIRVKIGSNDVYYVYASQERLAKKMLPGELFVPEPGEIICIWNSKKTYNPEFVNSATAQMNNASKKGRSYWNSCEYLGDNYILFEDSVTQETLKQFQQLFRNILLETRQ